MTSSVRSWLGSRTPNKFTSWRSNVKRGSAEPINLLSQHMASARLSSAAGGITNPSGEMLLILYRRFGWISPVQKSSQSLWSFLLTARTYSNSALKFPAAPSAQRATCWILARSFSLGQTLGSSKQRVLGSPVADDQSFEKPLKGRM